MNIKIKCSCETKFSFDIEPVDGRMPVEIFCPKCGANATELANQMIQQSSAGAAPVAAVPAASSAAPKSRMKLQVAHAAPVAASGGDDSGGGGVAQEKCSRHPRNAAVEHCVVCQKPICPECMQIFGYLCSIACKYRADQEKIKVPKYKFQKTSVEKTATRKSIAIVSAVLLVVFALMGGWFWYIMSGCKPRTFYTVQVPGDNETYARFLNPNQILFLSRGQASLHDIKLKKDVWTTALEDPKPPADPQAPRVRNSAQTRRPNALDEDDDEVSDYSDYSSTRPEPVFRGDDLWLCLSHNVIGIDLKSGAIKQTTPFKGRLEAFTPGETTVLVVSSKEPSKKITTLIDLSGGEPKVEEVASSLREKVRASKELPSNVLPTAALLLKRELDAQERRVPSVYKFSSEFFPAGQNLVEMQVKLVEMKMTSVKTMKDAGPSNLGGDTRASTSARAVAEEIFNEMKRADTGGFKLIDESHYAVLLRRSAEKDAADLSMEVTGLPVFFPQKTVDVLVADKNLFLIDKQNRKVGEAKLNYALDDSFTTGYSSGDRMPCVETNNTLFFYDQGHLTAFDLPGGNVRWRLPTVGISEIQFDDKGMLYVSTTTGSPEDIQYSEQIKIGGGPEPIIIKVDPATGKTLWKCDQSGGEFFLTGKYLYITDASRGGFSMIHATEEAFGARSTAEGNFRIIRVNPSNGKKIWSFNKKGMPENIDFSEKRILLHYGKEVEVMKYISF